MAPSLNFSNWWAKDTRDRTPVVVTMENPHYSVVEIGGGDGDFQALVKGHVKNAKQVIGSCSSRLTAPSVALLGWRPVYVHCSGQSRSDSALSIVATSLCALLGAIKKRFSFKHGDFEESDKPSNGKMVFRFIQGFLVISLAILAFEIVAT